MRGVLPRDNVEQLRRIRSFVRREGRLTRAQQQALEQLWPKYGLSIADLSPFTSWFHNQQPITLEIGFGNGDSLAQMAEAHPERNYIGIEVHRPGVGHLLQLIEDKRLTNLRLFNHDAVEVIQHAIPDGALDGVQLFFPDPWHKKRHHKRRLIQPKFVVQACRKLLPGGVFHAATDWENYAEHMLDVFEACPMLENMAGAGRYSERPESRPLTKFEQRGMRLGHGVWDLLFRRVADPA